MDDLKKYFYVNIRDYFGQKDCDEIGEADLHEAISDFSCPRNTDVERFLKNNAIEFTKKSQSVTYLVYSNEDAALLGYFTIALKPITINGNIVSNSVKRKLQRVSKLDEITGTYTSSAFLIAQIGKNYTRCVNERIQGKHLLGLAWSQLKKLQYSAGGMVVFLEAEDKEALLDFYQENHFQRFNIKRAAGTDGNSHELVQLFRLL
ncbi:MAG: GNAT family acetyltransferase [Eubacteriales bacterium]|nr:GNAT family acetyltransferase [Eubacteriales bacterium]